MSQTNLADGFPLIYQNYNQKQKKALVNKRQKRIILAGIKNAIAVDAPAFLSYAGMAIPYVKENPEYKSESYYKSPKEIKGIPLKNVSFCIKLIFF